MTQGNKNRFSQIIDGLTGRDREIKIWSIIALGMLRIPDHADALVDLLGSSDEGIVMASLEALGKIGNPHSVKYILEFVVDDRPIFMEKALNVLGSFDVKLVIDSILKAAGPDRPAPIRRRLLLLLSNTKDPRVAAAMTELLSQTQDTALVSEALNYFVRFPAPDKKAVFKPLGNSGQWEIAMAAQLALSRLSDEGARGQLKKIAKSPAHPIRFALVNGLNKAPMIEDRAIYEMLFHDPHPQIRIQALQGLHLFSPVERHQLLLEWFSREREDVVRIELLKVVIREKSVIFYEEFLKILTSSSESMKRFGRAGIIAMGPQILDKILLNFPKSPLVIQEQMILILGYIGGERVLPVLKTALTGRERWLKLNAIEALAVMQRKSFAPRFVEMLKRDDDVWVRATLLSALARLGDPAFSPVFEEYLQHSDARVRANAVEGFIRAADPSKRDLLEPFLRDPNDRVRVNTAIALWKMGDSSVIPALQAMIREKSKWMKSSAAFALGELGDRDSVPALLDLLGDPEDVVYRNALEALVKIGDVRALVPILKEKEKKRLAEEVFNGFLGRFSEKLRGNPETKTPSMER